LNQIERLDKKESSTGFFFVEPADGQANNVIRQAFFRTNEFYTHPHQPLRTVSLTARDFSCVF
jgi:hypothetical protein